MDCFDYIISILILILALIFDKKEKIVDIKQNNSQYLVDLWSFLHIESGFVYYYIIKNIKFVKDRYKFFTGLMIHWIFEIFENTNFGIEYFRVVDGIYYGDTLSNALMDNFLFAVGYYISENTNLIIPILLIIIFEISSYYIMRANMITTTYRVIKVIIQILKKN